MTSLMSRAMNRATQLVGCQYQQIPTKATRGSVYLTIMLQLWPCRDAVVNMSFSQLGPTVHIAGVTVRDSRDNKPSNVTLQ